MSTQNVKSPEPVFKFAVPEKNYYPLLLTGDRFSAAFMLTPEAKVTVSGGRPTREEFQRILAPLSGFVTLMMADCLYISVCCAFDAAEKEQSK